MKPDLGALATVKESLGAVNNRARKQTNVSESDELAPTVQVRIKGKMRSFPGKVLSIVLVIGRSSK